MSIACIALLVWHRWTGVAGLALLVLSTLRRIILLTYVHTGPQLNLE